MVLYLKQITVISWVKSYIHFLFVSLYFWNNDSPCFYILILITLRFFSRRVDRKCVFTFFHSLIKSTFLLSKELLCLYDKQNNTWLLVDLEFLFSCSTRHLTRSLRLLVSYRVKHSKRNSVSTRAHVLFSIYCTIVVQWVSCNQEITNLLTTPLAATHALFWNRLPSRMIIQLELVWVLLQYKWLNLWASEYMMLKNWNVYNCNICK